MISFMRNFSKICMKLWFLFTAAYEIALLYHTSLSHFFLRESHFSSMNSKKSHKWSVIKSVIPWITLLSHFQSVFTSVITHFHFFFLHGAAFTLHAGTILLGFNCFWRLTFSCTFNNYINLIVFGTWTFRPVLVDDATNTRKKLCYFRLPPNLAYRESIDLANYVPSSRPWGVLSFTQRFFQI